MPASALEIGTGWYPVVAMGMFLCGVDSIWTYDIAPLLAPDRLDRMLAFFDAYGRSGELSRQLPSAHPQRIERLLELRATRDHPAHVLASAGIHTVAGDARRTGLPDGAVDLTFSTAVLEYIAFPALIQLFRECRRVGSPAAAMSHYVDLSDQYSHFDPRISPINFLRFPSQHWKHFDNDLIPQSRLRISDYRSAIEQAGWDVRTEISDRADAIELARVRVAPEFRGYSAADLLVVRAWLTMLPRDEPGGGSLVAPPDLPPRSLRGASRYGGVGFGTFPSDSQR